MPSACDVKPTRSQKTTVTTFLSRRGAFGTRREYDVPAEYSRRVARITDSSVREVRAAADRVGVVWARTQLRRASGSRFTGRCPFHEERTPSFSVNPVEK